MSRGQSEELAFLTRKIVELRKERGYTQEQLNVLVEQTDGEGCAAFSAIENGHSRVTVQTLLTLAKIFQVPLDVFQMNKEHQASAGIFILEDAVLLERITMLKSFFGENGTRRLLRKLCASIMEEVDEASEQNSATPPRLKHDSSRHGRSKK